MRKIFLLVPLVMLVACGRSQWPPMKDSSRSTQQKNDYVSASFSEASAVEAGRGDTVYTLSRRHGVAMRAIIEANNLRPPYTLAIGQRIILPREARHVVRRGDTLYSISRNYNIDTYALARANGIKPPYTILVGEALRIPNAHGGTLKAAPIIQTAKASSPSKYAPLRKPQPNTSTPKAATPKNSPAKRTFIAALRNPRPLKAPPMAKPTSNMAKPTSNMAKPPMAVAKAPAPSRPPKRATLRTPPPRSGKGFLWPVRGKVLSSFGAKPKGLHNDGINIAAPRGASVKASENGVVAYAGNELRGFGNLLLVKHSGGWITAYAHNDRLLVKRGQRVRKGQIIAKVGSTGSVTKPQLHFEIRKGKRAIDPKKHLI